MNAMRTAVLVGMFGCALPLLMSCAMHDRADSSATVKVSADGSVGTTVTTVTEKVIPHVPGKKLVSLTVDYAPGGYSASHRHAASAFIYAYVLSGEIRSQVNDEPERVYKAGEYWFENPNSHHRVSANASKTKPARLLATFIVDESETVLTTPDKP